MSAELLRLLLPVVGLPAVGLFWDVRRGNPGAIPVIRLNEKRPQSTTGLF